ncbi:MAG: VWA domain-containing protein [Anaerolineae bacterium]|nr:VWA domain-containing protein [Anaerolineae bacterium]
MKRIASLLVLMTLLVIGVGATSAQIIVPPPGGVFTDPNWLKVDYHRVHIDISNQIATTHVEMQFTNQGEALAEGTFIFPLPKGATVDQLTMWVDGQPIDAKILRADEARGIYDRIVRQYRDPALLEYVGNDVIQANVFPIPPGDKRRIEISYSQVLEVDNGLIHVTYPLNTTGHRPVEEMSIAVSVSGRDSISSIYSPTHDVAISRAQDTDKAFRAGFEAYQYVPESDFSLFYGIASDTINLNLLTYRESASDDGFFMLLVQPPLKIEAEQVIPKDVIVVLDQSGSMDGQKWDQARQAATYVLENLNPQDRFNLILFSTGWRVYSNNMESPSQARGAIDWIKGQEAIGGTDINGALLEAFDMVGERPATILFMTDGLATEGETDSARILDNLEQAAPGNSRVFTFGVGDDVDTFLLDSIVRDHRGTGSYVRPGERIDEKVASLYTKISAPVLTDVELDFDNALVTDWIYPTTLPDLFAGEQLTLVGRYRGSADDVAITLRGKVDQTTQTFTYDSQDFRGRAGGEPFIAQLWATRRIGDLLNKIRLNGESKELVDSVVSLSVRYGIITPYTSFLIEEDDILSQAGRERAASNFAEEAQVLADTVTGASAVDAASTTLNLQAAEAPMPSLRSQNTAKAQSGAGGFAGGEAMPAATMTAADGTLGYDADTEGLMRDEISPIQTVNGKTFLLQDGVWTDTTFEPDTMETVKIAFLSDAYFDLLSEQPELGAFLALGERVIVVVEGTAYEITTEE